MKSISVAAAATLLAGITIAQPHGHHGHQHLHAKRELVTEWETVWETVTVLVDESTTETIYPAHADATSSGYPGEFFQPPTAATTPTSTSKPEPTVVETPTYEAAPPPPPPAPTTTTTQAPPPPPPPPAPTTTSTPKPAPAPEPEPTTTAAAAASYPASGGGSSGALGFGTSPSDKEQYTGDITYYTVGIGACGFDDSGKDSGSIVAISKDDWFARYQGTNLGLDLPNHPWCDQSITIKASNGKTAKATVRDNCPGCAHGSIDVSEGVFEQLFGGLGVGRSTVTWSFD